MNTDAVIVGAVLICIGLPAMVAGYHYYVTVNEANELMQDQLDEMGLTGVPGLDDGAKAGLVVSGIGAVLAIIGGILLAYGLLKRTDDIASQSDTAPGISQLDFVPGAKNFCEYCGRQTSPNAVSCPSCGRQICLHEKRS